MTPGLAGGSFCTTVQLPREKSIAKPKGVQGICGGQVTWNVNEKYGRPGNDWYCFSGSLSLRVYMQVPVYIFLKKIIKDLYEYFILCHLLWSIISYIWKYVPNWRNRIFHQPLEPSQIKSHMQLGMSNYKIDCLIFLDLTWMVNPLLFIASILHSPTFVSALFQGSLIVRMWGIWARCIQTLEI